MQQANGGLPPPPRGAQSGGPPRGTRDPAADRGISAESSSSDPGRSGSSRPDEVAAAAAAESNGSSNSNTTTTPPSAAEDSLRARRVLLQQLPPAAAKGAIPLRRAASSPWAGRSPRMAAAEAAAPAAAGEVCRRIPHPQLHYLRGGLFSPRSPHAGSPSAAAAGKDRGQQQWPFAALPQQPAPAPAAAAGGAAEELESNSCCFWFRFYLVRFFELWGGDDFARRSRTPEDDDPFYARGSISLILDDGAPLKAAAGAGGGGAGRSPRSSRGDSGGCQQAADAAAAAAEGAPGSAAPGKGGPQEQLQQQEQQERRAAAAAAAAAARKGAAARNPLRFAKEADELAYRRYLNSLYPFRLLVVGLLMLFVDLMQSASEATRWPRLYLNEEVFLCIIITFGIVVVLYGLLAVASKLPFVGDKLEAFSITVLALAFMSRVASLCAVVLISAAQHNRNCVSCQAANSRVELEASIDKLPGEYVSVETPEADPPSLRAASSADACAAELILLSCAALFHTLILDVMLPVRTMVSFPLHILYLGSCVGVLAFCAVAYPHGLSYLGPVCVISSCVFLCCGLLGRVQTEISHRQLYFRWRRSMGLLRETEKQLRSQHSAHTGIEKLALFVRRSQALLRRAAAAAHGDPAVAQVAIEEVADMQMRVLEIVTDVRSIYQAQMSTEEIREFRRFFPGFEGTDSFIPLECSRRTVAASPASSSVVLQLANAAAAPNGALQPQEATAAAAAAAATPSSAAAAVRGVNASAAAGGAAAAPAAAVAAAAAVSADASMADVELLLQQLPPHVAEELREKLGVDWDLDLLMIDEQCRGNALVVVGNMMLQPLLQREGLQCTSSQVVCFVRKVQQQYCASNLYHNQTHAAMVAHCCRCVVGKIIPNKKDLTYADEISIVVACLTHDLGHPGLTNQYLVNVRSPLAITYNDISVLENYHAACCFRTAADPEANVFAGLKRAVYQYIRQHTIELILATDMKKHFDFISHLRVRRDTPNFDVIRSTDDRWMVFKACIKAADLAHAATRWEQHKQWSERLAEEFYLQGDEEKKLGLPLSNLCDRERKHEFSRSQAGFLKVLVEPLFTEVAAVVTHPEGKCRMQNVICRHIKTNREHWDLIDKAQQEADRDSPSP
ncbi:hypothetical protein Efla_003971 [Eimeria flavescens]